MQLALSNVSHNFWHYLWTCRSFLGYSKKQGTSLSPSNIFV